MSHPTKKIRAKQIFQSGSWNGDFYDNDDLDKMVESFGKLGWLPVVKAGHEGPQENAAVANAVFGAPALGYVEKIWREGSKLLADIKDVPAKFASLIEAGAYRRVSSEIYWSYLDESSGKKWPFVLKAVAFLGAEIPAVTTLDDVTALYRHAAVYKHSGKTRIYSFQKHEGSRKPMTQVNAEVIRNYQRGDVQAGRLIDTAARNRMAEGGGTYGDALHSVIRDARQSAPTAEQQPDKLEEIWNAYNRYNTGSRTVDSIIFARAIRKKVSYSDARNGFAKSFSSSAVVRLAGLITSVKNDDGTLDAARIVGLINNDEMALAEAQLACAEQLDHLVDLEVAITGVPGSEIEAKLPGIIATVHSKHGELVTCANGGELSEAGVRELFWQKHFD